MSIVSHLQQLFNAETCQSYIHTLRWKDRPLQCPRCESLNVGPWGAYHAQPGLQRYRCKERGCKRTCNALTGQWQSHTLWHEPFKQLEHSAARRAWSPFRRLTPPNG